MAQSSASAIEVDLGYARLRHANLDLTAKLKSAAHIAPSEEDDIAQLRQRLTAAKLTDRSSDIPWIQTDNGVRLNLSVNLRQLADLLDQEEVINLLSEHIGAAKLWEQLHLQPSSIRSSYNEATSAWIVATHLDREDSALHQRRHFHKLGKDAPYFAIRPPQGVTEASCESFKISVTLSRRASRKRKRHQAFPEPACYDAVQHEGSDLLDDYYRSDEDIFAAYEIDAKHEHHNGYFWECEDPVEEWPEQENDELDLLMRDERSQPLCQEIARSLPLQLNRTTSEGLPFSGAGIDAHSCAHIIEAALQLAIGGSSCLPKKEFLTSKAFHIYPLVDAAPSVWSPDYLSSVASRVLFIPTIAHALGSVLDKSSGTTSIGRHTIRNATQAEPSTKTREGYLSATTLQPQLWQEVRQDMISNAAVRRLKPLWIRADDDTGERGMLDILLDGDYPCDDADEILNIDEDYQNDIRKHVAMDSFGSDLEEELLDEEVSDIDAWEGQEVDDYPDDGFFLEDAYLNMSESRIGLDLGLSFTGNEATITWQGGESKSRSPTSQSAHTASQSPSSANELVCKAEDPAMDRQPNSLCLPEVAGRSVSTAADLLFEDDAGGKEVNAGADLGSLRFGEGEMLCI